MKRFSLKLIALVSFFTILNVFYISADDKRNEVQEVYNVAGSKEEIYQATVLWFAESFYDSSNIIQLKDPDNGIVVGSGFISSIKSIMKYPMAVTVKVEIKENKVRITYSNIKVFNIPKTMDITWQISKKQIDTSLGELSKSIIDRINNYSSEKSDW